MYWSFLALFVMCAGCSHSGGGSEGASAPSTYLFEGGGESTVTYLGQSTYANLQAKLAGNDAVTDHADWNGGDFVGWEAANLVTDAEGTLSAPDTPESLLLAFFWTFATQAANGATGSFPIGGATPANLAISSQPVESR